MFARKLFLSSRLPRRLSLIAAAAVTILALAACSRAEAVPPPPTRTPAPTFTPTVAAEAQPVDPAALATAQAAAAAQPVVEAPPPAAGGGSDTGTQPITGTNSTDPAAPAPTEAPAPTNTPEQKAQVTLTQQVNVRGGPSTNYSVLGLANPGQTFDITGKNSAGDWWQINYNGQQGWVLGQLVTAANATNVAVAQNIPAEPAPPPVVVAPPTNTPAPPPPAEPPAPAPTEPPKSTYKFNVAVVGKCEPQAAGTWFEGKTYVNGSPQSGYKVVWSGAGPDGEWAVAPMPSGPHQGYEGWDQGYYSHLVSPSGPIAGTWFVWIVDDSGQRISEIASWTSSGNVAEGTGCNQAVVDFDSR